jgi:hypothetical protein
MPTYVPIMNNNIPLTKNGIPKVYDADLYPFGPPDECCCCPCCDCDVYEATLSGMSGGGSCTSPNGTYTLNITDVCGPWTGFNENSVAASLTRFGAEYEGIPYCFYRLRIGPILAPAQADYYLSGGKWECGQCNTMNLEPSSVIGACGWPSTVEVCCADEAFMGARSMSAISLLPRSDGFVPPPPPSLKLVKDAEARELFGDDADDPTLLGNRIAALTAAIGLPPCSGCSGRQKWLNAAHKWLRGE